MQDPLASILTMTRPQLEELAMWREIVTGINNPDGFVESLEQKIEAFKLSDGAADSQKLVETVLGWMYV